MLVSLFRLCGGRVEWRGGVCCGVPVFVLSPRRLHGVPRLVLFCFPLCCHVLLVLSCFPLCGVRECGGVWWWDCVSFCSSSLPPFVFTIASC